VWNRLGIEDYPLFYFAAPLLAFAILIPSHALVRQGLPTLHALLTGNRAGRGSATGSAAGAAPAPQPAGYSASQR
jgi:succinoglycan biosynthesis protein ExoH